MQEEVDSRTVALSISAAKFTGRLFKAAIGKYMAHRKEKKLQKARDGPVKPCGKQTVKQLIGQNQGVSTIESNDPEIKNFERIARKYGVDYAVKKVKTDGKPTQAFTEYSRKTVEKEKKPSVLKKLRDLSAVVKSKVLERTKEKQRGQSR